MEPGAERGEHLGPVSHQVELGLAVVDDEDPPSLGRQRSFYVLEAEAGQAVPVLDHDGCGRRVRKREGEPSPPASPSRADSITTSATDSPWVLAPRWLGPPGGRGRRVGAATTSWRRRCCGRSLSLC